MAYEHLVVLRRGYLIEAAKNTMSRVRAKHTCIWHDKDPSMRKGRKQQAESRNFSPSRLSSCVIHFSERISRGTSFHINQSIDQIPPLTLLSTAAVVTMVGGAALFTDFDLAPHAHLPPLYWNVTPTSSQPAHLDS